MKAKDLIDRIQSNYKPDDQLFVEYWDKECVEGYGTSRKLSEDEWASAVEELENGEFFYQSSAAGLLVDKAEEAISGGKNVV